MQAPPERLGSFYLGSEYDIRSGERGQSPINYDARDLTTHAVCVGMTGSGKTGLCVGLLEEAGLDRVPAILIDPKGDITNLLLQFPELRPADFQPWVNADDARRKGKSVEEYAQDMADLWRNGLADWGVAPERIRALQETVDYTIFTPGSDAGVPISILGSLAAPVLDFDTHAEAIRERITGTVGALLGLVGVEADPIRSREAILLSNIFEHAWRAGQDLDLAQLIQNIQNPPVRQVGVFDVDTFFPPDDRFDLAMSFNNLMAAPSFQSWLQGEPLDVDQLFFTAEGRPRHSIFYIAHLSEAERMFFVTLLLESVVTWMRRQSGTTSLRALLYFDEIFGFFPPTAEPPSKRPMLTLLKQARAYGLGCVLVTQNPVDLDYKGLTNAGTWFIGKLQAERDKDRVLAGLKGAIAESGGNVDIDYDDLIGALGSRVFLLHNVHADGPVVFHTRWAMSYLRGPLTRPQVRQLMTARGEQVAGTEPEVPSITTTDAVETFVVASPAAEKSPQIEGPAGFSPLAPALDAKIEQVYLPVVVTDNAALRQLRAESRAASSVEQVQLIYEPALLGAATVGFFDRRRKIDEREDRMLLAPPPNKLTGVDWGDAELLELRVRDLLPRAEDVDAEQGPFFAPPPEQANSIRELKSARGDLSDWLYYNSKLEISVHETLDLFQMPDESTREFNIRLQQAARERRDEEVDKLEAKYEKSLDSIRKKMEREERELAEDRADYDARKQQEFVGIGESVLNYFLGRRSSRMLSGAMSRRRMTSKAKLDIEESEEVIEDFQEDMAELEEELEEQTGEITKHWADLMDDLTTDSITPRRTDVDVQLVALAWLPSWRVRYDDGARARSATIAAYRLPE